MYGKLTKKYDTWSAWDTRLDKEIKFFEKLFKENNVKIALDDVSLCDKIKESYLSEYYFNKCINN